MEEKEQEFKLRMPDFSPENYVEVTDDLLNELIFEALIGLKERLKNPASLSIARGADGKPLFATRISVEDGTFQVSWQIPNKLIETLLSVQRIPKSDPTGFHKMTAVADVRERAKQ